MELLINKRRKIETNNGNSIQKLVYSIQQPTNLFNNEINNCKNLEQLAEYISNDSRLFYTKEQTIFIINKILELKSTPQNLDLNYYS